MVTINVNDLNEVVGTFVVHKNFICFHSPYFNAAFNGESQTLDLEVDDASPDAFAIFVNWLYTQRIEDTSKDSVRVSTLLELWILAGRLLIPKLQNATLRMLDEARWNSFSSSRFVMVYENTPQKFLYAST